MKNKGVIITIMLILVLGAGITVRTRQFVKENASGPSFSKGAGQLSENEMMAGESLPLSAAAGLPPSSGRWEDPNEEAALPESAAGAVSDGASASDTAEAGGEAAVPRPEDAIAPENPVPENTVLDNGHGAREEAAGRAASSEAYAPAQVMEETVPDGSVFSGRMASTEETAVSEDKAAAASPIIYPSSDSPSLAEILTREDYEKKLAEVDSLVKSVKENNVNASTDSLKNIADYEYRLWDTELNRIYQAVMSGMDEEETENLRVEEREWIRKRDSDAKKAASKYKGGTMENLEYMISLADSTRSRAYGILEDYGKHLPQ